MNDRTIISAISTLHRVIVSFAIFIFLVGSSSYFLLKDGVLIDKITLAGLDVEKLYIKWDEKISLSAKRAYVTKRNTSSHTPFEYQNVANAFRFIKFFEGFVGSVNIEALRIGEAEGSFHYNVGTQNDLVLSTPKQSLRCRIDFSNDYFVLNLDEYRDTARKLRINGTVAVRLSDSEVYAHFVPEAADVTGLHLYAYANKKALSFALSADGTIADPAPLVDLFGLPHGIRKWIVDYADGSGLTLHAFHGTLPYDNPEALLRSLYAKATYHNLAYTFNRNTDPIRTSETELVFENGVLDILPGSPRFYDHDGGNSWLKIDFTAQRTLLTAFILADTQLDDSILHLLDTYGIRLPFIQTGGTTRADLKLDVILANGHTDAVGTFEIGTGLYRFQGVDFNISNASVSLHGADVTINSLEMRQDGHLEASISGYMNPVRKDGHLKIAAQTVLLGAAHQPLTLTQPQPLHIDYILGQQHDTIIVEPSIWRLGEHHFDLQALRIPFDFGSGVAQLSEIPITYNDTVQADVSGLLGVFDARADLKVDLHALNFGDLTLNQPLLPLKVKHEESWKITASRASVWDYNGTSGELAPFTVDINGSRLHLSKTPVKIGGLIRGDVSADCETDTATALLTISGLTLQHPGVGTYFNSDKALQIMLHAQPGHLYAASDDLDLAFEAQPQRWDLFMYSLKRMAKHSELLRQYELTQGHLQIHYEKGFDLYGFSGAVYYPYPVIVQNERPSGFLEVLGNHSHGRTSFSLNDAVHVDISDKITVSSQDVGYNLGAILKVLNTHHTVDAGSALPPISLNASDSFIYFTPERRAVADSIRLYTSDSGLYGRLNHKDGVAILELKDGKFFLYGNRFGDLFMRHLLAVAQYRGGSMSFHVNGTTDEAHGVVRVQDTTVKDYKTLNNILAFVNTVPSLATFSLPHYSDKGLEVSDAYASFHYKDHLVKVDGVKVDSHEIDITGSGVIDYIGETVNMELNLITDAGTNVSKVPLVGYILVGDKGDVSTTLKIKGDMNDPKVSTGIAKGIVVAPFKMLMRTITLPFNLFKKEKSGEEE